MSICACRRTTFSISLLLLCVEAQGQWVAADLPGTPMNVQHVYSNANRDTIYYAGALPLSVPGWQTSNSIMRYANGDWDSLGVLNSLVHTVVIYNDTLIAGGGFDAASGTPCNGIAYWDGP